VSADHTRPVTRTPGRRHAQSCVSFGDGETLGVEDDETPMMKMSNRFLTRAVSTSVLALAAVAVGCNGNVAPGPTPTPTGGSPPTISAISPTTGSTGGGTTVKITGSGFQPGATVTLDDERRPATVESSTSIQLTTSAHDARTVDVAVTNPGGQVGRLSGAYTYAPPQSFDFNGTWEGYALAHLEAAARITGRHSDMGIRFTIQANLLTSVTCDGSTITLSPQAPVSNGEFSSVGADGAAIAGRIVSADGAVGTISAVPCPSTRWSATRR
jgi:hypothetical protein